MFCKSPDDMAPVMEQFHAVAMEWMIVAGAVTAAAYGELILDIRTPHASLAEVHGITSTVSIPLGDYQEAMKKKYGPDADTVLTNHPPG